MVMNKMMQKNSITFNDSELHAVLINHTRYCLTRRSYAVSECCDLLRVKWSQIPKNTQVIICRDIKEAIDDDNRWLELSNIRLAEANYNQDICIFRCWDECDRIEWERLFTFIDRVMAAKARGVDCDAVIHEKMRKAFLEDYS